MHIVGGKLLLELNRVLRPGGYFVWSATPVYQKLPEDVGIWKGIGYLVKFPPKRCDGIDFNILVLLLHVMIDVSNDWANKANVLGSEGN